MYNKLAKDMDKTHQNPFDRKKIIGNKAMFHSVMTIQRVRILDEKLLAKNITSNTRKRRPRYSHAHHIIPNELVVEGTNAVTGGLIGGSFLSMIKFFDQAWNGVFLGTSRNIAGLPMHTSSHPEYTAAVRNYIGGRISDLVTDSDYAQAVARVFRIKLLNYYRGGVADISIDSAEGKGVSKYYQDRGFNYLNEFYRGLSALYQDDFRKAVAGDARFARERISSQNLYDLGFALEHEDVKRVNDAIAQLCTRSQMEVE